MILELFKTILTKFIIYYVVMPISIYKSNFSNMIILLN